MSIEEKIVLFSELTEEERGEVERYVAQHPEWEDALEEARSFDRLLQEARSATTGDLDDETLAFFATSKDLPNPPPEAEQVIGEIRERIASDPGLQRRLDDVEARMAEMERISPAGEQLRRLRQRRLAEPNGVPGARTKTPDPPHIRYMWRIAATIVVLAATYSLLYKLGVMIQPEPERLARFSRDELLVEGFEAVRQGNGSAETSVAALAYLAALDDLRHAQQSVIGLFPRFDEERLGSAARNLEQVLSLEPEDSFLALEASYLLAKVDLATGDVESARPLLQRVVEGKGRRAPEAARILSELED